MKYCTHCGKEIMDEAVICVGCGCEIKSSEAKYVQKISTFTENRKKWIIAFTSASLIFAVAVTLILTSAKYIRLRDYDEYLGVLADNSGYYSYASKKQLQEKIDRTKSELLPYYIGLGVCGTLGAAALTGDILLLANKNKEIED